MRIANNVVAMNTHRAYTSNNDRVQTSAEKLSSGYRINRAGDDAAGLAISEKMRSQVRGLNMATRNSQDAVSLIQTAEGALQEVHSMLQRMNELAVQSATGTNEDFDRTQIAKEFEQLKSEIDDISQQTTFNNMKLLDGSLSYKGPALPSSYARISDTYAAEKPTPLPKGITVASNSLVGGTSYVPAIEAKYDFSMNPTGNFNGLNPSQTLYMTLVYDNQASAPIEIKNKTLPPGSGDAFVNLIKNDILRDKTFDIGGKFIATFDEYVLDETGNYRFKSVTLGHQDGTPIDAADFNKFQFKFYDDQACTTGSTKFTGNPYTSIVLTENTPYRAPVAATAASNKFNFKLVDIKSGDVLTIGNTALKFYDSSVTGETGQIDLKLAAQNGLDTVLTDYFATVNTKDKVTFSAQGTDTIKVTYAGNAGTGLNDNTPNSGPGGAAGNDYVKISFTQAVKEIVYGTTTFTADISKMQPGDMLVYKDEKGKLYTATYRAGKTAGDLFNALGIPDSRVVDDKLLIRTVGSRRGALTFEKAPREPSYREYAPMRIQIGALEGDSLDIKIESMNSAGLGVDIKSIFTQEEAGTAVTATRDAINKVSDQRALLGAMQNRITHKIANLKVSVENLQASESRIRDIDIASEMTTFTKNNILSQAATSMLAQANNMPQNVLSLLR